MTILTEIEGITSRWCDNHDCGEEPFHSVRSERRSERSSACPESWERENTLSSTLSDQSRLTQQHRDEVAEGRQCNEKVEAFDGTTGAQSMSEEQRCGNLL